MKRNNIPILDSTLVVKSTASLREEIINDLLRPDQSLGKFLKEDLDESFDKKTDIYTTDKRH
jgi:hypothetical protein